MAHSPELRRLSFHARDLTREMSARHLSAILVPFERLSGRALRDDEFLITDTDKDQSPHEKGPLLVIADNIRSAFNVGAILRTSECFSVEAVWLSGYTATPDEEKTSRTSMGTEEHVQWRSVSKVHDALTEAKTLGYQIIALETAEHAQNLDEFQWPEKSALLIGNERFGIEADLLTKADHVLRIPLFGKKNSLNVGIALGIALADWRRQRPEKVSSPQPQPPQVPAQAPKQTLSEPTSSHQAAITLTPIGVFHSPARHPYEARRQGTDNADQTEAWIELHRGRQFEQALSDLNGFSHLWLLYGFHHNTHWKPMVMPPRGPRTKRGVFATRSPYRPNPLGLSCVELDRIDGLKIYVHGFDLLDETPIYDIKPYLPYADSFPHATVGWLKGIENEAFTVRFSELAEKQLLWLEKKGVVQLRGFLEAQLEYEPLDEERKRVQSVNHGDGDYDGDYDGIDMETSKDNPLSVAYVLAYRTWRAQFRLETSARQVTIERIFSGYSPEELLSDVDSYRDLLLHRAFVSEPFA